jgi:hypothetical protein
MNAIKTLFKVNTLGCKYILRIMSFCLDKFFTDKEMQSPMRVRGNNQWKSKNIDENKGVCVRMVVRMLWQI